MIDTSFLNRLAGYLTRPEALAQFRVVALREFAPGVVGVQDTFEQGEFDIYFDTSRWGPKSSGLWEGKDTGIGLLKGLGCTPAPKDFGRLKWFAETQLQPIGTELAWHPEPKEISLGLVYGGLDTFPSPSDDRTDLPLPLNPLQCDGRLLKAILDRIVPDPTILRSLKFLVDRMRHINHSSFTTALHATVERLNPLIADKEYVVLWDRASHKSMRWVYHLAFKHLVHPPCARNYFGTNFGRDALLIRGMKARGIDTFVIFDDGAYTGEVLFELVGNTLNQCQMNGLNNPRFLLAVPFVSQEAEEEIRSNVGARITVLGNRTAPSEIVVFDHNVPDSFSAGGSPELWQILKGLVLKLSGFQKPYMRPESSYYQAEEAEYEAYQIRVPKE